ncbi:MAG: hypothetical protein AAFQ78_03685, partial [Bacteroidota bacterium]
ITNNNRLALTVGHHLHNEAKINAAAQLDITANQITNTGALQVGQGKATLTAGDLKNQSLISSGQALSLNLDQRLQNEGQILTEKDLKAAAIHIDNTGTLQGGQGTTTLTAQKTLKNTKSITSAQDLQITVGQALQNKGNLVAGRSITVTSAQITNEGDIVACEGDLSLTTNKGDLDNQHVIKGGKNLSLEAQTNLINTGGIIGYGAKTTLTTRKGNIINRKAIKSAGTLSLKVAETLQNDKKGAIAACHSLQLMGGTVSNQGTITGGAGKNTMNLGTLQNKALINSVQGWRIDAQRIENHGQLSANTDLVLQAAAIENQGHIVGGNGKTTLTTGTLTNSRGGHIISQQDLEIATKGVVFNHGQMATKRHLSISATKELINNGKVAGGK